MYKLLLVDDEMIIRQGLADMIPWEKLNLSLTASCANALSALDSMMDDMPDILLTDVRMPGMDGLELTERAMALHPKLQVLILSGYDTFAYAQQALRSGVMEYLLKPCAKGELEEALVRATQRIDKERLRLTHLHGERMSRVQGLSRELRQARESAGDAEQLRRLVHEVAKTAEDPGLLQEALVTLVTSGAEDGEAAWGLGVLREALEERQPLEELLVRVLLRLKSREGTGKSFVQRMIAYVEGHYQEEKLSLQYLADQVVYMNADYIGREFHKAMGSRFSAYLLGVRMERAKRLMAADPALHSYEIAEQVGLGNNPHYFSQVFRKYTGTTPKEYRETMARLTNN